MTRDNEFEWRQFCRAMTREQIMAEIILKQDELIQELLSQCLNVRSTKNELILRVDIASLKSRLAEAGEEKKPVAYEWHNHQTGHCYVDYIPHVGQEVGYIKTPLFR